VCAGFVLFVGSGPSNSYSFNSTEAVTRADDLLLIIGFNGIFNYSDSMTSADDLAVILVLGLGSLNDGDKILPIWFSIPKNTEF
jgi:hypothetical protein